MIPESRNHADSFIAVCPVSRTIPGTEQSIFVESSCFIFFSIVNYFILFYFTLFYFTGVKLLSNVVLVSAIQ